MDENYIRLMKERKDLFVNNETTEITVVTDLRKISTIEREMMRNYINKGHPKEWEKVGTVFEDKYIKIVRDAVMFNNKYSGVYDRILSVNSGGYDGISLEANALKEIREEINGKVHFIEPIGEILIDSGIGNKAVKLYYAELSSFGECNDSFEVIKNIKAYTFSEVENMINNGKITDNISIGSIYKYKLRKQLCS